MGASNFTYVEASWTQAPARLDRPHTRAFAALGGVSNLLVPDNTKVGVIKAGLYRPQVNRTYADPLRFGTRRSRRRVRWHLGGVTRAVDSVHGRLLDDIDLFSIRFLPRL